MYHHDRHQRSLNAGTRTPKGHIGHQCRRKRTHFQFRSEPKPHNLSHVAHAHSGEFSTPISHKNITKESHFKACATNTHSLGQVARALRRVQDLVVENGEVEGQAEADGVRGRQVLVRQVGCGLVGVECVGCAGLTVLRRLELGKIPVRHTGRQKCCQGHSTADKVGVGAWCGVCVRNYRDLCGRDISCDGQDTGAGGCNKSSSSRVHTSC